MLCCFMTFSLYLFDTLWENFDYFPYLGQKIWYFCWEELEISYYFLYKSEKTEILIKSVCFKHITSYLHHITILWRATFSNFFFGFQSRDHVTSHDVILTFFMKKCYKSADLSIKLCDCDMVNIICCLDLYYLSFGRSTNFLRQLVQFLLTLQWRAHFTSIL